MVGRVLTVVAVIASLVALAAGEAGSTGWWLYALSRAAYVLVIVGIVAALLTERGASLLVVWAQVLTGAATLAFVIVGLVKYYDSTSLYSDAVNSAFRWLGDAELLSAAVLAFGLTLPRRRTTTGAAVLAAALVMTLGCGFYALYLKQGFGASMWWTIATVGAFLAGAAAAGLNRGGAVR